MPKPLGIFICFGEIPDGGFPQPLSVFIYNHLFKQTIDLSINQFRI